MGTIMKLILIVDDMPANLEFAVGMLKDHYKVAAAKSGEKALAFLEKITLTLFCLMLICPVWTALKRSCI